MAFFVPHFVLHGSECLFIYSSELQDSVYFTAATVSGCLSQFRIDAFQSPSACGFPPFARLTISSSGIVHVVRQCSFGVGISYSVDGYLNACEAPFICPYFIVLLFFILTFGFITTYHYFCFCSYPPACFSQSTSTRNAETVPAFWSKWNIPVHRFARR